MTIAGEFIEFFLFTVAFYSRSPIALSCEIGRTAAQKQREKMRGIQKCALTIVDF